MSLKKGFVCSRKDANSVQKILSVNPTWYYNWNFASTDNMPSSLPFVPMVWGESTATNDYIMNLLGISAGGTSQPLLGFNEPDRVDQSNLTVSRALALWPNLVKTGCRLGSPATAANPIKSGGWFDQFMIAKPKVDFITLHWYAAPNVTSLLNIVDTLHVRYNLPVWITEFAVADWKTPNRYTTEQVANFMKAIIPELEKRPHVERYCWKTRTVSDPNMGSSSLFFDDGSLTDLGKLYFTLPT
jgi:hypothetical protein